MIVYDKLTGAEIDALRWRAFLVLATNPHYEALFEKTVDDLFSPDDKSDVEPRHLIMVVDTLIERAPEMLSGDPLMGRVSFVNDERKATP